MAWTKTIDGRVTGSRPPLLCSPWMTRALLFCACPADARQRSVDISPLLAPTPPVMLVDSD